MRRLGKNNVLIFADKTLVIANAVFGVSLRDFNNLVFILELHLNRFANALLNLHLQMQI